MRIVRDVLTGSRLYADLDFASTRLILHASPVIGREVGEYAWTGRSENLSQPKAKATPG